MRNNVYKLRGAYIDWISHPDLAFLITPTLKRAVWNQAHGLTYLRQEDLEKTARLFYLWLEDALLGKRRRKGHRLTAFATFERGTWDGNPHFHIATANPRGISAADYENIVRAVASKLDWINTDLDIRPITGDPLTRKEGIAKYCLKQGLDALLTDATYIPRCDQGSVALS